MNKLKVTTVVFCALLISACDYIPREIFEIETKDGKVLKLACPVVDIGRSELTYLIDGYCVVHK